MASFTEAKCVGLHLKQEEVLPGTVVDLNEQNQIVGIKVLYLSKRHRLNPQFLEFETV